MTPWPNHALQRTRREASRLQSLRPVRRVAELGSLYVAHAVVNRTILIFNMGLFSFLFGSCSKAKPSPETKGRQAVFADLRNQALTGTRADFGLDAPATPTTPWGVVMETGFPEGSFTLVAFSDGSASIYLSSGGGSIGGGAHEVIRRAAQAMVALAAKFQPLANATREFPLPRNGQTIFYLLTDSGAYTTNAPEQDLGEERHPWSPLFHAGHEVIGQYRMMQERK